MWSPDPEIVRRVDFSQLHMLDHPPFSQECRQQYGGPRQHLWVAWEFYYRDRVLGPFRRVLNCTRGKHEEALYRATRANGVKSAWVECLDCRRQRYASEKELQDSPEVQFRLDLD